MTALMTAPLTTPPLTSAEGQPRLPRYFATVFGMAQELRYGRLDFILPDGRRFRVEGAEPGPVAEIAVHDRDLFARLVREGDLGFCEAYMEGGWSTPDLMALMDLIHAGSEGVYDGFPGLFVVRAYERLRFWLKRNSRAQAKRNIAAHYDLGNAFYGRWLDGTMTYSSALFHTGQESLEAAQTAKYAHLVDQMGVKPGDRILEIGCGWGGFAEYAAKERGLDVTALTISRAQYDYATQRIREAGLQDRARIRIEDYRDHRGTYDGVASIEMFEAVGERFWPVYFGTLRERLRPGGNATLQVITVEDRRWEAYRRTPDFIQKYIFPGGMLPAPTVLRSEIERAGLSVRRSVEFGQSYSQTLRRWSERFNAEWEAIRPMGFDDRFRRMWNLYFASCAGAFRGGNCDVTQITVTRPA